MSEPVDVPSAQPPPSGGVDPAKLQKKKDKARKEMRTFWARVVAQVVGAAASVALGLFLVQRSQQAAQPAASVAPAVTRVNTSKQQGKVALAVLPLNNFSESPGQDYFADGMHEALTAELARMQGLHVISRTSTTTRERTTKRLLLSGMRCSSIRSCHSHAWSSPKA